MDLYFSSVLFELDIHISGLEVAQVIGALCLFYILVEFLLRRSNR